MAELIGRGQVMEALRLLRLLWRSESELADELARDYLGCELWPREL